MAAIGDRKVVLAVPPRYTKKDAHLVRELIEARKCRAAIDRWYPMQQVVDAMKYVLEQEKAATASSQ
jgi:hypothetical protein